MLRSFFPKFLYLIWVKFGVGFVHINVPIYKRIGVVDVLLYLEISLYFTRIFSDLNEIR
jgi:hypothetical protein